MSTIDAARLAEAVVRWLEKPGKYNYIDVSWSDAEEYRHKPETRDGWVTWMQEIVDEYDAAEAHGTTSAA